MGRFQMYRNIQHTLLKLGLLVFLCHDSVQAQTGLGVLEVTTEQQEPVTWIMGHMKLVVIIGCSISAGGVVLIAGLTMLDCCFNSRPAAVADESVAYSQAQARQQQPWDAAGAPQAVGVSNRARGRAW